MNTLSEEDISCPYCGEMITILITPEDADQKYIEDCQVCCKPIVFLVQMNEGGHVNVTAYDENEAV